MHSKSSKSTLNVFKLFILFIAMFSLCSCGINGAVFGTKMEFSFNTNAPSDSGDEKIMFINDDMDELTLNAVLKIDTGEATVQVLSVQNNDVIWSNSYKNDSEFKIELFDLKAGNEYLLKINATQSQKVNLTVTSGSRLVKDKEKPEKYIIDNK